MYLHLLCLVSVFLFRFYACPRLLRTPSLESHSFIFHFGLHDILLYAVSEQSKDIPLNFKTIWFSCLISFSSSPFRSGVLALHLMHLRSWTSFASRVCLGGPSLILMQRWKTSISRSERSTYRKTSSRFSIHAVAG